MIRQSSNFAAALAALAKYREVEEQECFAAGYNSAHGLVCHNTPTVGQTVRIPDDLEPITVTYDNLIDVTQQLSHAAEEHSRQFSPWEQIASRINAMDPDDPLHYWNIYDEGVALAILHDLEGLEHGVQ